MSAASLLWGRVICVAMACVVLVSVASAQVSPRGSIVKNEPIRTVTVGDNGEFIVNGQPFLPIMSWAQSPRNYAMLRSLGINTFCGGSGKDNCDAAQKAGGYAVIHFADKDRDAIGHRSLLGWIHSDEPDMPQRSKQLATPDQIEAAGGKAGGKTKRFEPREAPALTAARYRKIKAADDTRPVFLTFTGHFTKGFQSHYPAAQQKELYGAYAKVADVVGFDIYPVYGHGRPGWLNRPADGVAELRQLAGPGKPVYPWIESHKGSKWMTYEKQPDVLPEYTRFEVWGSLINGATSYGYFTHAWRPKFTEFAPTKAMQAEMLRLNTQVTRLAPAILASPAATKVTMVMSDGLGSHFKATKHDGSLYLFAQNRDLGAGSEKLGQFDSISPRGGTATFTVGGLAAGTKIEVVDENRTIVAKAGGFSDKFAPLAEHVYKIGM